MREKAKRIIVAVVCLAVIAAMVFTAVISPNNEFFNNNDKTANAQVVSGGGEWKPISDYETELMNVGNTYKESENQILNGVFYKDGVVYATLHPYVEGVYDENNHPDAVGSVEINIYEDTDENWIADAEGTEFTNLISTGTAQEIELTDDDLSVEVDISEIPQNFIIEAKYVLAEAGAVLISEKVSSFDYTEEIQWVANATVKDLIKERNVDPDYIQNMSEGQDEDGNNYTVYKENSLLYNNGEYAIQKCEEENTYIIVGLPEEFLEKYKTNEELSKVPQLLMRGTFSGNYTLFTASENGEANPIPIAMKYYRATVDDPQSEYDYEYRYAIEYVYPEDLEGLALQGVSQQKTSSTTLFNAKNLLENQLNEQMSSLVANETVMTSASVKDEGQPESDAIENESQEQQSVSEENKTQGQPESVSEEESSKEAETIIQDASKADESVPVGIKFTLNADPGLVDIYDYVNFTMAGAPLLAGLSKTETKTINENGVTGEIKMTPSVDITGSFKFWKKKLYVKVTFGLESNYKFESNSEIGIAGKTISFKGLSADAYGVGVELNPQFSIDEISGKGRMSGQYVLNTHLTIGIGSHDGLVGKDFSGKINYYYASSPEDGEEFLCETTMDFVISVMGFYFEAFGFEVGPLIKASSSVGWGYLIIGSKDEEEEAEKASNIEHLCNTQGDKLGCTDGFYQTYLSIGATFKVDFGKLYKKTWTLDKYKERGKKVQFFSSEEFKVTKDGYCPYKIQNGEADVTASPDPGVYLYNASGLNVTLKTTMPKGFDIYFFVADGVVDDIEGQSFTKYTGPINLKFNFGAGESMSVKTIYAYVSTRAFRSEIREFKYIMLNDGITCLMNPTEITMPAGNSEYVTFIHPSSGVYETVWKVDNGEIITYSNEGAAFSGIDIVKVTGKKAGTANLTATCRNRVTKKTIATKTCTVTVTDDLAVPTVSNGTNFYLLRKVNTIYGGMGDYKDNYLDSSENDPYYYHDGVHSLGLTLSHVTWTDKETLTQSDTKIYYTTDGSTPTVNSKEYEKGTRIYFACKSGVCVKTLKAIAYNPVTDKTSDVGTWTYVIADQVSNKAKVIMIPETKRLSVGGAGLVTAIYVPSYKDLIDPRCWISTTPTWSKTPIKTFKVNWSWRSGSWLTVPVLGTNEWISEPLAGFDFVQVAMVLGLKETGKDDYVPITATAKNKQQSTDSSAKGTCKVYVYDDDINSFTVHYDGNGYGVTNVPPKQTKEQGVAITLSDKTPARDGFTFKGWSTRSDSSEVMYQPSDVYTNDEEVTLYAVWELKENKYFIEYDANGGTGAPNPQVKDKDTDITLSTSVPKWAGHTFIGWSTDANSKTAGYAAGATYSKNESVVLYAVWEVGTAYKITYDANGGSGAPEIQSKVQGTDATISTDIPTWEKHVFKGWATTKGATSVEYEPGATYSTDADLNLYAVWRDSNTYPITYDTGGGTTVEPQTKYENEMLILREDIPTKLGSIFMWWKEKNTGELYPRGDYYKKNAKLELEAVWRTKVGMHILFYDANGGTGAPDAQEFGSFVDISTKEPTREGYYFLGWSENQSATEADIKPGIKSKYFADDTRIYAVWTKDEKHVITYEPNGADATAVTEVKYGNRPVTIKNEYTFSRTGYDFVGWATNPNPSAEDVVYVGGETYSDNKDLTLYAIWQKNSKEVYIIKYDANGGEDPPESRTKLAGNSVKIEGIPDRYPVRSGYKFVGWGLNKDSTVAKYQPGDDYKANESIILYAIWEKNTSTYEIFYDVDGGDGGPGYRCQVFNKTQDAIIDVAPTKDGYVFKHWLATNTVSPKTFTPGDTYTDRENLMLKAIWEDSEDTYAVYYDANGGTGAPGTQTASKSEDIELDSKRPTKSYCNFLGWSTDKNATTAQYQPQDSYTARVNVTLYAVWESNYNTITFDPNGGLNKIQTSVKKKGETYRSYIDAYRTGYKFLGWSTDKNATSAEYSIPVVYSEDEDLYLYAVWSRRESTYIVHYDANGGSNAPYDQSKAEGETVTISSNVPVRDGFTFLGWSTDKTSKSATYYAGNKYSEDADLNLYAVWADNSAKTRYKVTVKNGYADGAEEGLYLPGTVVLVEAAVDEIEYINKDFSYWTAEGITLSSKNEVSATFQFIMPANNVNLEAVFVNYGLEVIDGTILTEPFDGQTSGNFAEGEIVRLKADDPGESTQEGVVKCFDRWLVISGDLELTEEQIRQEEISIEMPADNVVIEAIFAEIEDYDYNFFVTNGTIATGKFKGKTEGAYKEGEVVIAVCDNIEGKIFDHWEVDDDESRQESSGMKFTLTEEQKYSPKVTIVMPDSMVAIIAVYTDLAEDEYALYVKNGTIASGTYENKTMGKYKAGDEVVVICDDFTDEKFDYWEEEGITLDSDQKYSRSFALTMPANNVTVEAITIKEVELPYTLDVRNGTIGGTGGASVETFFEGNDATVIAGSMTGESFEEWYVISGNLTLTPAQMVAPTMTLTMPDSDVVITPVYTGETNNYKLCVVNGTITTEPNAGATMGIYQEGETASVACDAISGKIFDHWEAEGITLNEAQKYDKGLDVTMPDNDVYLTAVYYEQKVTPYKVEVVDGTLSNGATSGIFYQGNKVTAVADPNRTFTGWRVIDGNLTLTDAQKNASTMSFTMPADDVIIAASYNETTKNALYVVRGTITDDKYNGKTYGEYDADELTEVTADDISGWAFDHWEAEGVVLNDYQKKAKNFELQMPDNDVVLRAVFTKPDDGVLPHKLTVISGTDVATGKTTGTYFACAQVAVTPDVKTDGRTFDKWEVLEGDLVLSDAEKATADLSFDMPDSDVTIRATYTETPARTKFSLITLNGTIKDSTAFNGKIYGEYSANDATGAKADVISGKKFDHWEVVSGSLTLTPAQAKSEEITFTMPESDVVIRAHFDETARSPHRLEVIFGTIDGTTRTSVSLFMDETAVVTADDLSVALGTPVAFKEWKVRKGNVTLSDAQKTASTMTFTMPDEDVTLLADFEFPANTYTLDVINGKITTGLYANKTAGIYVAGTVTSVECDTISGKTFDHWEATGITLSKDQETAKAFELTMPAENVTLTAVYTDIPVFTYKVEVINGKLKEAGRAAGNFYTGDEATAIADAKPSASQTTEITELEKKLDGLTLHYKGNGKYTFKKWVIIRGGIDITDEDIVKSPVSFTVKESNVKVAAAYEFEPEDITTGDKNQMVPWLMAMLLCAVAVLVETVVWRKRKSSKE